ncbi:MAG: hypothetical protein AAF501_11800 [Pseudomonadota bacterium]
MISRSKQDWIAKTLKINVKHAEVTMPEGSPEGFAPRALGQAYEGETEELGWRVKRKGKSLEAYEKQRAQSYHVTRTLDQQEVMDRTVKIDDQGRMSDAQGFAKDGQEIYAVDLKTGDMVADREGHILRTLDSNGKPTDAIVPHGAAVQTAKASGGQSRAESLHHSSIGGGGDVAGAGKVTFDVGRVERISNESGHYKPRFVHLLQVVEHLLKSGAILDTRLVDCEGVPLEIANPKAFLIHKKLRDLSARLPSDRARLMDLVSRTSAAVGIPEEEYSEIDAEVKRITRRCETVRKAQDALDTAFRDLGISPRNALKPLDPTVPETQVDFNYASDDLSGLAFRNSDEITTMPVSEFLMGKDVDADTAPSSGVSQTASGEAVSGEAAAPAQTQVPYRDIAPKKKVLDDLLATAGTRTLRPVDRADKLAEGQEIESTVPRESTRTMRAEKSLDEFSDALDDVAPPASAVSTTRSSPPNPMHSGHPSAGYGYENSDDEDSDESAQVVAAGIGDDMPAELEECHYEPDDDDVGETMINVEDTAYLDENADPVGRRAPSLPIADNETETAKIVYENED